MVPAQDYVQIENAYYKQVEMQRKHKEMHLHFTNVSLNTDIHKKVDYCACVDPSTLLQHCLTASLSTS